MAAASRQPMRNERSNFFELGIDGLSVQRLGDPERVARRAAVGPRAAYAPARPPGAGPSAASAPPYKIVAMCAALNRTVRDFATDPGWLRRLPVQQVVGRHHEEQVIGRSAAEHVLRLLPEIRPLEQ